ncbi:Imm63 family immunity protein [Thalassospira alkalitolerans]|uniref:Imm63 family immunity protein n=1 Tax=Thalassospira alkalitolerans TaxID=1293890 RepID=UPI003AA8BCF5
MNDLEERIKECYARLNKRFSGKSGKFPFEFFIRDDAGYYHIECNDSGKISFVGTDRGRDTCRYETYDVCELMYWIFKGAAFSRGQAYEFEHRHPTNDPRRIWFPKAVEEISKISPEWAERMKTEQEDILQVHPFIDDPFEVAKKDHQ